MGYKEYRKSLKKQFLYGTENTTYFESEYASKEDLEAAGADVAERVHEEGVVLLKNDGVLPLDAFLYSVQ